MGKSMDDRHGNASNQAPSDPSPPSNLAISNLSPPRHDTIADLDLQYFEQRVKQWTVPSNLVRHGMSDEWQANI
jgi:hypothetical protein